MQSGDRLHAARGDPFSPLLDSIQALLRARTVILLGVEPDGTLPPRVWRGFDVEPPTLSPRCKLASDLRGSSGGVVVRSVEDYADDVEWRAALDGCGVKMVYARAIRVGDEIQFALSAGFSSVVSVDEPTARLFSHLAELAGLVIENAILSEDARRYRRNVLSLNRATEEIAQVRDLDDVLGLVAEKAVELADADLSYVGLLDPDEGEIRVAVTVGASTAGWRDLAWKLGEGVPGEVALTEQPRVVDNWSLDSVSRTVQEVRELTAEGVVSAVCVPLRTRRGLLGVLYAASRREANFTREQLEVVQRLGSDAAIAIENLRLFEEQRDAVAQLHNHVRMQQRFLDLVLADEALTPIADTLAAHANRPVIIEDQSGNILATSNAGHLDPSSVESGTVIPSRELLLRPTSQPFLTRLRRSGAITFLPAGDPAERTGRLVAPVLAGSDQLGYVSIVDATADDPRSQAALAQAALVTALEFKKKQAARGELFRRTLAAQEGERIRIARELHDETSQAVAALKLGLQTAQLALTQRPEDIPAKLEAAVAIADHLLAGVHHAIADLRPPVLDEMGLSAALSWYGQSILESSGMRFSIGGDAMGLRLREDVETSLFRIAQEALANVARHSGASEVVVTLSTRADCFILEVRDDGRGFESNSEAETAGSANFGLTGMRERAEMLGGTCWIQSAPEEGTRVVLSVPWDELSGAVRA